MQILFADEPISNLGSKASKEVLDLPRSLSQEKGITILIVIH